MKTNELETVKSNTENESSAGTAAQNENFEPSADGGCLPRSCSDLRLEATELEPLESENSDRNLYISRVTLQIDNQMPMTPSRRGYVNRAFHSGSSAKIIRVPAMVFGEFVVLYKSDVGLLIESDFDNIFGA